jgi:hypothetical protein
MALHDPLWVSVSKFLLVSGFVMAYLQFCALEQIIKFACGLKAIEFVGLFLVLYESEECILGCVAV